VSFIEIRGLIRFNDIKDYGGYVRGQLRLRAFKIYDDEWVVVREKWPASAAA
jgi:hypothetical protein